LPAPEVILSELLQNVDSLNDEAKHNSYEVHLGSQLYCCEHHMPQSELKPELSYELWHEELMEDQAMEADEMEEVEPADNQKQVYPTIRALVPKRKFSDKGHLPQLSAKDEQRLSQSLRNINRDFSKN
jgi:hypothetical protein